MKHTDANPKPARQSYYPNRRLALRLDPHLLIQVACRRGGPGPGEDIAIALLDLSMDGAGLFLRAPVRLGEELALLLSLEGRAHPSERTAVVVWAVPTAEGTYCAGVRFVRPLSFDEFARLAGR